MQRTLSPHQLPTSTSPNITQHILSPTPCPPSLGILACTGCSDKLDPCTGCLLKNEPIFHIVPPTTQKIYQSQAYMRYIEGLNRESNSMCDWKRELSSSQDILNSCSLNDEIVLPSWLDRILTKEKDDTNTDTIDTIFALRDFMLQETLSVVKFA